MKLTLPPIEISPNEGFSSKDIFKRKDFGERLANLIEKSNENLVLALDAPWGEGKSTFIKMWKGYIEHHRDNKFKAIYFDAFANDYQREPFLALAAEIYELLKNEPSGKKTQFRKKASKAIKSLARGALSIGVRAATVGLLDGSVVDDLKEEISDVFSDQVDKVVADRLKNSEKDKLALDEFRKYLADFAKRENGGQPLVFIIDELDRCRPDFALELIEQIKHLFSVKGITFLLVMSRAQLEAAVSNRYGQGVKAAIYLQKFINLWLTLPRSFGQVDHGMQYFRYALNQRMEDNEKVLNDLSKQTLEELVKINRPSYREIEHLLSYFALLHNMIGQEKYLEPYQLFIAFICYVKTVKPDLIESICRNSIDADKLRHETGLDKISNEDPYAINELRKYIKFDLSDESTRARMMGNNELNRLDYGRVLKSGTMAIICGWLADISVKNL